FGWAQVGTSNITGIIADPTGAVISGAKVQAKNEATGMVFLAESNSAGAYTFPSLSPGQYTVTATKQGFQTVTSVHNALTVGVPLVVDLALKVGATSETVEVESNYQRVETTNATLGDTVTREQVQNLPLNGRNPLQLLTLEPGVVQRPTSTAGSGTHV